MIRATLIWRVVLSVLVFGAIAGLGLAFAAETLAQETIEFRISKYNCPTDPGNVSPAAGNIPDECDPVGGVAFTVAGTDGAEIASCTTDDTGLCIVDVPNEADVVVTEDVSTAPSGYTPRENPISTTAVTEFAGALFINLPTVVTPPATGTGTLAAGNPKTLLPLLGALSLALLTAGFAMRRRPA
jgi:hypothetical protein